MLSPVLKIAILAEKFAMDYKWYVDVILNLIRVAGDYIADEVRCLNISFDYLLFYLSSCLHYKWTTTVSVNVGLVTQMILPCLSPTFPGLALQAPTCHENMVKVGAYILGEFGNLIAGDERSGPLVQFRLLHSMFHLCSNTTKYILLSTYVKFINLFPEIKTDIEEVLSNDNQVRNSDAEIQQRAIEYTKLSQIASADLLATVLEEMPQFTERESGLLAKLKKKSNTLVRDKDEMIGSPRIPVQSTEPATDVVQTTTNGDSPDLVQLVLKIAILAEKFAMDYKWYVDVILNLIRVAGDYIADELFALQMDNNCFSKRGTCHPNDSSLFITHLSRFVTSQALQAPTCHENMVKVGAYILGEFGNLIAGDERSGPLVQFRLLHSMFHLCSNTTKYILLSTYVKFINLFPEINTDIEEVLSNDNQVRNSDAEIQQRAIEYTKLSQIASADLLATVLEEMPQFTERESGLLAKLKKKSNTLVRDKDEMIGSPRIPVQSTDPATDIVQTSTNGDSPDLVQLCIELPPLVTAPPIPTAAAADEMDTAFTASEDGGGGVDSPSLNHSTPPAPTEPSLLDMFGATPSDPNVVQHAQVQVGLPPYEESVQPNFSAFVCSRNNGVLYEDDLIQIGVKSDYSGSQGRLTVFYGNKSQFPFQHFATRLFVGQGDGEALQLEGQPIAQLISAGAQVPQTISANCLSGGGGVDSPSLNHSTPPAPTEPSLLDMFGATPSDPNVVQHAQVQVGLPPYEESVQPNFSAFVCSRNNGVLYEDDLIQIGVKSDYSGSQGRLTVFYGNKSQFPFQHFATRLFVGQGDGEALQLEGQPIAQLISAGAQVPQTISANCLSVFREIPILQIAFTASGSPRTVTLRLPIMLQKFYKGMTMNAQDFFARWKNLGAPGQEFQKVFKATKPMETEHVRTKVQGFGLQLLDGVDPRIDNLVAAGIVQTESSQIGCLVRLEPSKPAQNPGIVKSHYSCLEICQRERERDGERGGRGPSDPIGPGPGLSHGTIQPHVGVVRVVDRERGGSEI
eukprot:sb/3461551/